MPGLARRAWLLPGAAISCLFLWACGNGSPGPTVPVTGTANAPASSSAPASPAAVVPPAIVAVTAGGALVTLNPATGAQIHVLVARHVLGDEISVSATGMVYFAVMQGCSSEVEGMPVSGGAVAQIAQGSLPAVSPDGTKLGYASEPDLSPGCLPSTPDLVGLYHLMVRTLSTGTETLYPMAPASQNTALPAPISHLSWSADGHRLAVSIAAIQDNEGWNVVLVDPSRAHYYLTGAGTSDLPATALRRHAGATCGRRCTCPMATCSSAGPAALASRCITPRG